MIKLNNIVKIYNPKKANEFEALHGVSAESLRQLSAKTNV